MPENPKNSSANQAAVLSPVEFRYARIILLIALVSVGFGFTVLFAILGPLGREVGMSELQISSIIAASSLVVFLFGSAVTVPITVLMSSGGVSGVVNVK